MYCSVVWCKLQIFWRTCYVDSTHGSSHFQIKFCQLCCYNDDLNAGKTLGLLSASCAWLERYREERSRSRDECKACRGQLLISETDRSMLGDMNSTNSSLGNVNINVTSFPISDVESFATCKLFFVIFFKTFSVFLW